MKTLTILVPFLLVACSENNPTPTAPAGKVHDGLLGMMGQAPEPSSQPDSTGLSDSTRSFSIELVFLHQFEADKQRWIEEVVQEWELFFEGGQDSLILHIDHLSLRRAHELAGESRWNNVEVRGATIVTQFRANGITPLRATIEINDRVDADERTFKGTIHHELGHAFGIGTSPAWTDGISTVRNRPYFTGENALREYRALGLNERSINRNPNGIRLQANWGATPIHWIMANGMHGHLFQMYYLRANDLPNISTVTLGAFADIGWLVWYDMGLTDFPALEDMQPCGTLYICPAK